VTHATTTRPPPAGPAGLIRQLRVWHLIVLPAAAGLHYAGMRLTELPARPSEPPAASTVCTQPPIPAT